LATAYPRRSSLSNNPNGAIESGTRNRLPDRHPPPWIQNTTGHGPGPSGTSRSMNSGRNPAISQTARFGCSVLTGRI
jgi:hypothetical protein